MNDTCMFLRPYMKKIILNSKGKGGGFFVAENDDFLVKFTISTP